MKQKLIFKINNLWFDHQSVAFQEKEFKKPQRTVMSSSQTKYKNEPHSKTARSVKKIAIKWTPGMSHKQI